MECVLLSARVRRGFAMKAKAEIIGDSSSSASLSAGARGDEESAELYAGGGGGGGGVGVVVAVGGWCSALAACFERACVVTSAALAPAKKKPAGGAPAPTAKHRRGADILLGGSQQDKTKTDKPAELRDKMTSEQDLFCSCCAMVVVSVFLWRQHDFSILPPSLQAARVFELDDDDAVFRDTAEADVAYVLCLVAGVVYAFAMMSVMKAWEHVPSTIVVPLMQLSGPLVEMIEALLGSVARRRGHGHYGVLAPVAHATLNHKDFFAFALITVGGLMPSTESMPQLCRLQTWRRPAMALLLASNLLYSVYFVLLALCVGADTSKDPRHRLNLMEETQFVVVSNFASVATLAALFSANTHLRRHMNQLRHVALAPQLISGFAEFTNYFSMLLLTSAYQLHYSSGLVTAARTGLNQFINVIFAVVLYSTLRIGRPVKDLRKKLVAAAVVCVGLFISTE